MTSSRDAPGFIGERNKSLRGIEGSTDFRHQLLCSQDRFKWSRPQVNTFNSVYFVLVSNFGFLI